MAPKGGIKFKMGAAVQDSFQGKRAAESSGGRAFKVPKASDCTFLEQGPKPQSSAKRLPAHAPVHVCVYKYTDEAADVWNLYEGREGVKLWQVQMQHEARPSITFDIVDEFNRFLCKAHARDNAIPASLADLQQRAGIKLVLTDRTDPDDVGFVQWRVAFYVAGSETALNNFLFLLDDFVGQKCEAMAREMPLDIHIHPHAGVNITDARDNFVYEHYTLHEAAPALPLGIFEAQPVWGKKVVQMHIQPESADTVSVLMMGNIWNFRSRLESHGVPGAYYGGDEDRKYTRLMKSIDVSDEAQRQRVFDMTRHVFKNLAIKVVLDSTPEDESEVAEFVDELRQITSLHFTIDKVTDATAQAS